MLSSVDGGVSFGLVAALLFSVDAVEQCASGFWLLPLLPKTISLLCAKLWTFWFCTLPVDSLRGNLPAVVASTMPPANGANRTGAASSRLAKCDSLWRFLTPPVSKGSGGG